MMDNESKLFLEIWQNFRDLIPTHRRDDLAFTLLKSFEEYGFDVDASEVDGEDEHIDNALELLDDDEDSSTWDC
jgi:hypothetical protein